MKKRALRLFALIALLPGQQANAEPPPLPPPYSGSYQPEGIDEIGLWRELDENERALAASSLVIRDENLTAYAKQVLCMTVGQDRCDSVRIYIIREPSFNATMTANGIMRIFSGLLLRTRNEAELGSVLGHEFGHFESRHTLERFKAHRSGTDILAWANVLAGMSSSYDVRRSYQDLQLSVYGNLFRFSRNNEREADTLGIAYLNSSELQPQAASMVWQNLMAEAEASARVRGLKKPNFDAIAFTASHPPDGERARYLSALALPTGIHRDTGEERYREALADWLPIFLEDQIKLNDFGASEYIIQSLAANGWTAELWFARGELYRTRGNQRDLVQAIEFYNRAIEMDPAIAQAYRGQGLSLIKTGRSVEGHEALYSYLKLNPAASDAGMIRMMLPAEEAKN